MAKMEGGISDAREATRQAMSEANLSMAGLNALNRYVEQLGPEFSEADRADIYNRLIKYNTTWYNKMADKLNRIPIR